LNITSRERVIKTLTFDCPDRVPRDLWILPENWRKYPKEIDAILEKFSMDIEMVMWPRKRDFGLENYFIVQGNVFTSESLVDEWGCTFQQIPRTFAKEVKEPIVKKWTDVNKISPPYGSLWKKKKMAEKACKEMSNKFVLGGTFNINPFERMQYLRGTAQLYMDIIDQPPGFFMLRDIVHNYYLKELEVWTKTDVDGILFGDDWGSQKSLLIHPDLWRELFKPLYREYCEVIHSAGKFVFMHSDGYIFDIYEDLIEIGVDAINSQLFCMNIEEIGKKFKGKITFWGEIDRQHVLASQNVQDVHDAVQRIKGSLYDYRGGVISQCEFSAGTRPDNVKAIFEEWNNVT